MANENQIDFLAVGDIVTDAFIKLRTDQAWIENDNPLKDKELCMRFGEKLPYEEVIVVAAVGNSPNAAVSAHRLGLRSGLATDMGDDKYGEEQLAALKNEGIATDYVHIHKGMESNYHYVLRYEAERTILVKHTNFPFSFPAVTPAPRFIYLSSLAENSLPYHMEIAEYLRKNPETKLVFQPGTFQISLGRQTLKDLYKLSYIFFCNIQEAQKILETKTTDPKELLQMMHALGPQITVLTDGPGGAYVSDGNEMWWGPMYPDPAPPVDRTGAGDAFASTFTSALALGKTIDEALRWGPINSMSVVQYVGAQKGLLTREQLERYLAEAPADYVPKKI